VITDPHETLRDRLRADLERATSLGDLLDTGVVYLGPPARDRRELLDQLDQLDREIAHLDGLLDDDALDRDDLTRLERAADGYEAAGRPDMAVRYRDTLARQREAQRDRRERWRQERERLRLYRYVLTTGGA